MDDKQKKEALGRILRAALAQKYIRLQRPVTQREWAQELGVSPTSLTDWISGTRLAAGDNLTALLNDPDVLELADKGAETDLYRVFGIPREGPMLRQVLADLKAMPPDERKKWVARIEEAAKPHRTKSPTFATSV